MSDSKFKDNMMSDVDLAFFTDDSAKLHKMSDVDLAFFTDDSAKLHKLRNHRDMLIRTIIKFREEGIDAALDCFNEGIDEENADSQESRHFWFKVTGGWGPAHLYRGNRKKNYQRRVIKKTE